MFTEIPIGIKRQVFRTHLGVPLWNSGRKKGLERSILETTTLLW